METKVSSGTIARTICLVLVLVNQLLTVFGISPIPVEDESVALLISTGATIVTALINWWKNNSFSAAAIEGDALMKKLKSGE